MSALAAANVIALTRPPTALHAALCPWEDRDAFTSLHEAFVAAHTPAGPTEIALLDRLVMIEWRRRRLIAAEAAVHVAHAYDRANEDSIKGKLLNRVGVMERDVRDQISVGDILRGTDRDDAETIEAITIGVADVEAALELLDQGASYEQVLSTMDEELRDWWDSELTEEQDGKPTWAPDAASLRRFLDTDALPWRSGWLRTNAARPAIRAQAIAESFDPLRLRQLWDMEARLDRQFEKALAMLIRLQEMRPATASRHK